MRGNPIDAHTHRHMNTFIIEFSIVTMTKHSNAPNCGQDEDDLFTVRCSTDLTLIFRNS